jgi:PAS domain S-box-containing protein
MALCTGPDRETRLAALAFNQGVIDAVPLAACLCDRGGRVLAWNRAAVHLWGREPDRGGVAEHFSFVSRFSRPDGTELTPDDTPVAAVLASGIPVSGVEMMVERPNGSRVRCVVNAAPLQDARDEAAGVMVCFQIVSVRKNPAIPGENRERRFQELLEALPAAIYTTDAAGKITFYNEAAVAFSGRRPKLGADEWCGSWRLFWTDGTPMRHDECPMAIALAQDRPIRGREAIAERPDGSRVHFLPYPTPLHDDDGVLVGAVNMLVDITDRKHAEQVLRRLSAALEARAGDSTRELADKVAELRESDRRFRLLVNGVTDYAIFMLDADGRVTNWNPGAERIKGYTEAEIVGRHFSIFYGDDDRAGGTPERALAIARTTGRFEAEGWRRRKDGTQFWASVVIDRIQDDEGKLIGFAKVTRDLTEKRSMEDQLRHAQKMEAIGQLTGGIAHDFNNLLAVVVGNLEVLLRRLENNGGGPDEMSRRLIDGALRGADRAAALTGQLLAFARQQTLDPQPIETRSLIEGVCDLLRRSLGERIVIEIAIADDVWAIFADGNQLENALVNLAVNARDAMANGGRLTIAATNAHVATKPTTDEQPQPGDYVVISVSDTGAGMSADVVAKAFEPFFTTKVSGEGTGLGLSQVYGFVKQSGGQASIESRIGTGTTIRLRLPRFQGMPAVASSPAADPVVQGARNGELILLVEDDDLVRPCSVEMIEGLGYRVVAAREGNEALGLLETHPEIRLVFTDLGLPGTLNGEELAQRVRKLRPGMNILFTTGYVRSGKAPRSRDVAGTGMIPKPFTLAALGEALERLLKKDSTLHIRRNR